MEKPNNFKIPKEFSVLLIHEEDANQLGNKLQYILPPGSDFEDQKLDVLSLQNFDQETDHCVKLIPVSNAGQTLPLAEVQYLTMDDDTAIAPFASKAIKVEIDQDSPSAHNFCHDFASDDTNMTTCEDEELVTSNILVADLCDFVPESDERYDVSKRVEYLDSSSDCEDIKPNVAMLDLRLSYELNSNFNNRKLLNGDKHKLTMSNGMRFHNSSQCRKIRNDNKRNEANSMTHHLNVTDAVTLVSVKNESSDYYECDNVLLKECYVKLQPLDILDLEKIIDSKRTHTPNNSQISTTLDADGHKQNHSLSKMDRTAKRRAQSWTEQSMERALVAVRKGMAVQAAAREFNIPRRTLRNHMISGKSTKRMGGPATLAAEEESELCNRIISLADVGMPLTPKILRRSVFTFCSEKNLPHRFKHGMAGRKWLSLFLRRHPEIARRKTQNVNPARAIADSNI